MVQTFRAFLEFCYIARRNVIDTQSLMQLEDALNRFHHYRTIFQECGVRLDFNLPRQHFLSHYPALIHAFGAPNGLCSSITESKHIKAVKKPWRRSNKFKALRQMLLTNQRLDKLAASRVDFASCGMLAGTCLSHAHSILAAVGELGGADDDSDGDSEGNDGDNESSDDEDKGNGGNEDNNDSDAGDGDSDDGGGGGSGDDDDDDDDDGYGEDTSGPTILSRVHLAKTACECWGMVSNLIIDLILLVRRQTGAVLANSLNQPDFVKLIRIFLQDQLQADSVSDISFGTGSDDDSDGNLPEFHELISVYLSAVATFYAPSDLSGIDGMRCEHIRATPRWQGGDPRYDCVFVNTDPSKDGMRGLEVARVHLFFSFKYQNITYPCALVQWYSHDGDEPDEDTGMWIVEPDSYPDGSPLVAVIHLDSILRAAHLIGVYGEDILPKGIPLVHTLDIFHSYYVNKYIDHHAFEIAF